MIRDVMKVEGLPELPDAPKAKAAKAPKMKRIPSVPGIETDLSKAVRYVPSTLGTVCNLNHLRSHESYRR